jgi:1,4-alpha-glucan branching enzyme
MHFVLTLHSHLPYVLNHGRWPHGSDWLCEATLDTYLPLLEALSELKEGGTASPVTLGITPVLANQLDSPRFREEMDAFFAQRLAACDEAPSSLEESGDRHLFPLVDYWRARFLRLRELFRKIDGDLLGAFRSLEEGGRLEIISSAATHGFLPLLGREESIRLQLAVGFSEHRRLFGRDPRGCWAPECAYRPEGPWDPIPGLSRAGRRAGLEEFLAEAGFRYFFIDTHMAEAGEALGWSGDVPHGTERFDAEFTGESRDAGSTPTRSAQQAYFVGNPETGKGVAAFVREPEASMQVWSRQLGYPGDGSYLEFHKIRWPGGLKYWSVTGPEADLGEKKPYDPREAHLRASSHASHFAGLLGHIQRKGKMGPPGVAMAPFDTELFGHWWFEGVDFLRELFVRLPFREGVIPVTASEHLDSFPAQAALRPLEGSWGANGDFSMWLNDGTRWTWERLWPLEERFWEAAPRALGSEETRPILAHAARQLLLAQSSDWQFMISTGAVPDYAQKRLNLHCDDAERLLDALNPTATGETVAKALETVAGLQTRDEIFPDVLNSVEKVLNRD